jgi:dienelactone hydrolase
MILFLLALAQADDDLAAKLRDLPPVVVPADSETGKRLPRMLEADADRRIREANERETAAWRAIRTREDWEKYRDAKIAALRDSLGPGWRGSCDLDVRVTRTLEGEGHAVENLVFDSRPGVWVTANLYRPAAAPASPMPGILICHSHHNPKTEGELQDMGVLWARAGCTVLVMDQLGHGERRWHPFKDAASFPEAYRVSRQDYWFRWNTSLQLYLAGESLAGWMAGDLSRGVDVLLARGADRDRILLLGAVAGGGDPAAVAAALDRRIAGAVPFNFGGPQPETRFPLPEDAEARFNYAGGGSWESTRNLRGSAAGGFLPWVIVGSVAPRVLIYGHEFSWDRERDPVWARLGKIWDWYGKPERLAATSGRGRVTGQAPESTHCNNIGAEHRKGIHPVFQDRFGIGAVEVEKRVRRSADELRCVTPELGLRPVLETLARTAKEGGAAWPELLGEHGPSKAAAVARGGSALGDVAVERVSLESGELVLPLILLVPRGDSKRPCVLAVGQEGKAGFLRNRSAMIAELLRGGAAVALLDVRGTGETRLGSSVGRTSGPTSISATELMAGRTLLGLRLGDLRTALAWLRTRGDLDPARIALWGDSFVAPNGPDVRLEVPWDAKTPDFAHPLGGLLALFGGFVDKDLRAVYSRGGLASWASVLESPFVYVPHDAIVPGALRAGDLPQVAARLVPPLRQDATVDGRNRPVGPAGEAPARWLLDRLR